MSAPESHNKPPSRFLQKAARIADFAQVADLQRVEECLDAALADLDPVFLTRVTGMTFHLRSEEEILEFLAALEYLLGLARREAA